MSDDDPEPDWEPVASELPPEPNLDPIIRVLLLLVGFAGSVAGGFMFGVAFAVRVACP